MDTTPNLSLPYIMPAQAQKHVTHNEAIRSLDALVQLGVTDHTLTAPPSTPSDGERFIIASPATGAWATHDNQVAAFQDNAWAFLQPKPGWLAWSAATTELLAWDGTAWITAASSDLQNLPQVGINATADSANRLSVASPATLLNHDGSSHNVKVNKAATADTASLLFQTNYSGRAEIGTTGDDNLHIKVSPDGSTWQEAVTIDHATADVTFTNDVVSLRDLRGRRLLSTSNDFPDLINTIDNTHVTAQSSNIQFSFAGNRKAALVAENVSQRFVVASYGPNQSYQGAALIIEFADATNMENTLYLKNNRSVGIGKVPTTTLDVDGPIRAKVYAKAGLPTAAGEGAGATAFVSDASGGAQPAYSDGTSWLKVRDGQPV